MKQLTCSVHVFPARRKLLGCLQIPMRFELAAVLVCLMCVVASTSVERDGDRALHPLDHGHLHSEPGQAPPHHRQRHVHRRLRHLRVPVIEKLDRPSAGDERGGAHFAETQLQADLGVQGFRVSRNFIDDAAVCADEVAADALAAAKTAGSPARARSPFLTCALAVQPWLAFVLNLALEWYGRDALPH